VFRNLGILSLILIYLVILAGGVVRSTGSGMGCPDWPKCFGKWIPPTTVSELPANYKEIYSHKNFQSTEFNARKTWIEYVNRLLGALFGVSLFALLISAWKKYGSRSVKFLLTALIFVLTGFQGWLGSVVVSTNLAPWMITIHMACALLILGLLLLLLRKDIFVSHLEKTGEGRVSFILLLCMVLTIVQISFGIQVRQIIDAISYELDYQFREQWIGKAGTMFLIHRSFSLLVLMIHIFLIRSLNKNYIFTGGIKALVVILPVLLILEIGTGIIMAYLSIPAFAQPIHMLVGTLMLGVQFLLFLKVRSIKLEAIKVK
jgi:heme a synthase